LVAIAVIAAIGVAGTMLLRSRAGAAAAQQPPLVQAARTDDVIARVDADVSLAYDTTMQIAAPVDGVVTAVQVDAGERIKPLQTIVMIDNDRVVAVPADRPFYRDLASGNKGSDVRSLQRALNNAGYEIDELDGEFGEDTEDALEEFQDDKNMDVTGGMSLDSFVSVPRHPIASEVQATLGARVQSGGALLAAASTSDLVAVADVAQIDLPMVAVGQEATVTFDALDDRSVTGEVMAIASQPLDDGGDGVVRYEVTIAVDDLPRELRPAMTGQAQITVDRHRDAVVLPSAAVQGSTDSPYVEVYRNGQTERRSVEVGLTSGSDVEILSGVASGEQVVIGQASDAEGTDDGGFGPPDGGGFGDGPPNGGGFGGGGG
jgi:macrolide-specific efflux system membrane fusion protein